jgi:hypothetical protein
VKALLQIILSFALVGSAYGQSSTRDCQELFRKSDLNRDGELGTDELTSLRNSISAANVEQIDPAAVSYDEFMIACRKGVFASTEDEGREWSQPLPQIQSSQGDIEEPQHQWGKLPDGIRVTHLMGMPVYTVDDEHIGRLRDVLVSSDARNTQFILGIGGFLGMGEQYVTVEMSQLKFISRKEGLIIIIDAVRSDLSRFDVDP